MTIHDTSHPTLCTVLQCVLLPVDRSPSNHTFENELKIQVHSSSQSNLSSTLLLKSDIIICSPSLCENILVPCRVLIQRVVRDRYLSSRNRSLYDKRYVGVEKGVPFSYSDTRYIYRECMHISWQSRLAGRNGKTEISIEGCLRPAKPCVSQTQAPPYTPSMWHACSSVEAHTCTTN